MRLIAEALANLAGRRSKRGTPEKKRMRKCVEGRVVCGRRRQGVALSCGMSLAKPVSTCGSMEGCGG